MYIKEKIKILFKNKVHNMIYLRYKRKGRNRSTNEAQTIHTRSLYQHYEDFFMP